MKKLLTYVLILGGVILATLSGCKMEELATDSQTGIANSRTSFFDVKPETNPLVKELVNELKQTDDSLRLSEKYAKMYGYPVWEKAMVFEQQGSRVVLIPVRAIDERKISSIWSLVYGSKTFSSGFVVNNRICLDESYQNLFDYMADKVWPRINPNQKFSKQSTLKGITVTENCWETYVTTDKGNTWTKGATHCSYNYEWTNDNSDSKESKAQIPRGNDGGAPSTPGKPKPDPVPVPIIYDDSLSKNPCAKLAWDLLKTNYSFNNIIQKFLRRNSLVDIKFDVISIGNNTQAKISILTNNAYTISIDNYFASHASTLEVGRAMIHEIIHAELNYFFNKCGNNLTTFQQNYPSLYARWQAYGFDNKEVYQHEEIQKYYRRDMKDMLKNTFPGYADNVYDAIIWGGLTGTQEWANLSASQQSAVSAIVTEQRKAGTGNCSN